MHSQSRRLVPFLILALVLSDRGTVIVQAPTGVQRFGRNSRMGLIRSHQPLLVLVFSTTDWWHKAWTVLDIDDLGRSAIAILKVNGFGPAVPPWS